MNHKFPSANAWRKRFDDDLDANETAMIYCDAMESIEAYLRRTKDYDGWSQALADEIAQRKKESG